MIFAYFGPETFLPLTSILAGIAGFLLMCGKNSWYFALALWRGLGRLIGLGGSSPATSSASTSTSGAPEPHLNRARYLERRRAQEAAASSDADTPASETSGH